MRRSTFNASFQCSRSKARKNGEAPIELSLSINGKRKTIQLPKRCRPEMFWGLLNSKTDNDVKTYCTTIQARVNEIQTNLTVNGESITVQRVMDYFRHGASTPSYPLKQMFEDFLATRSETVKLGTIGKYKKTFKRFLEFTGHTEDDEAGDVTFKDIATFNAKLNAGFEPFTVVKELKNLKAPFSMAHNSGLIKANPFARTKIKEAKRKTVFLVEEEIERIRNLKLAHHSYENVRDQFLFLCFTGLEYADLLALTPDDVQEKEGELYIVKKREKDGEEYTTFLYEDAKRIWKDNAGQFQLIRIQTFNRYLKEVARQAKIAKNVTSNVGRHTFATRMLSKYHLPIETVSKMVGHTNIKQTQYYAKLLDTTVVDDNLKALKGNQSEAKPVETKKGEAKRVVSIPLNTKPSYAHKGPCGFTGENPSPIPTRRPSQKFKGLD